MEEQSAEELKEKKLSVAAIRGRPYSLEEIFQQDELILDRIVAGLCKARPLHVAASHGHTDFVKHLLQRNQELAEALDSQRRTALHLASARGHVDVVKELIRVSPQTCLTRDQDGRKPINTAAINGQMDVVQVLFEEKPHAARSRVEGGDTILHLCAKYGQTQTLQRLLKLINVSEFINAKDVNGNTLLHVAVSDQHFEMVKYALDPDNDIKIKVNATNMTEQTPLDIVLLAKDRNDAQDSNIKKIENHLRKAGAKKGKDLVQREWLSKKRDAIMVVESLIATMAFQAGVSPPGGVWSSDENGHRAGEAVMAYNYPDSYPMFLRANTVGFVASLSTILLLISGLPFRKRAYMWGLVVTMWLTITAMAFTYAFSITVVTPKKDREPLSGVIMTGLIVWSSVMVLLFLVHTVNLIASLVDDKREKIKAIRSIVESSTRWCLPPQGRGSFTRVNSNRPSRIPA